MSTKSPPVGDKNRAGSPLTLRADIQPATINDEARTVDVVWTTGEKVLRSDWDGQYYEELSLDPAHVNMSRLTSGRAPLLANHDSRSLDSVIGVVQSARVGTATVRFVKDDPAADAAWNKVRQGALANISVGYRVDKFEKVEGGDKEFPTYRATSWQPFELSLVPMGADSAAAVRSDTGFVTRMEKKAMPDDTKTPEVVLAVPAVDVEAERAAGAKLERERTAQITKYVRGAGLDESFAKKLIDGDTKVDAARALILEELAKRSDAIKTEQHTRIEVGEEASQKQSRGMAAALVHKAGLRGVIQSAVDKKAVTAMDLDGSEFRGLSIHDMARMFLESRGVPTKGLSKPEAFIRAFNYRSAYAGTSDFSVLFENVMHKALLSAYETTEDTWSRFCGTKEVDDFRTHNFFRAGTFGVLPAVAEGGEYQNSSIPDGVKSTVSVSKYGDVIALGFEAMINDDLSALADVAVARGRGARMTIEAKVYEQLALNSALGPTVGGVIFFSVTNANINGSATANTAAGWDADRVVMASQTDAQGNYINLRPSVLLVPLAKSTEARVLNASIYEPTTSTFQKPNSASNMYKDIIDTPRLTGSRRYAFADPSTNPAIVVAFLKGQGSAPSLESSEGWRTDGTEWKMRLVFGVSFFDPKCAVTNAGA